MTQEFEYKFVRLGEGMMNVTREGREGYQEAVHQYAREGWRLVQIFAPPISGYGRAKYYELVLERAVGPR